MVRLLVSLTLTAPPPAWAGLEMRKTIQPSCLQHCLGRLRSNSRTTRTTCGERPGPTGTVSREKGFQHGSQGDIGPVPTGTVSREKGFQHGSQGDKGPGITGTVSQEKWFQYGSQGDIGPGPSGTISRENWFQYGAQGDIGPGPKGTVSREKCFSMHGDTTYFVNHSLAKQ